MGRLFILFGCVLLTACGHTGLTRNREGSLLRTVRDPFSRSCGNLLKPREYCGTKAGAGQSEKPLTETRELHCVRLYEAALQAANIQCGYEDELAYIHANGEYSLTSYLADRLKQVHYRYKKTADNLAQELEDAYNASDELSDAEELTYQNVLWSLRAFASRMRLDRPTSTRKPASDVSDESLGRMPLPEEPTPELMQRLLQPRPPQ